MDKSRPKPKRGLERGPEANTDLKFVTSWSNGLTPDEKKTFEEALRVQTMGPVFEKLRQLLEEQITSINRKQGSEQNYDSPSWALHQAHLIGRRQGLQSMLDLITPTGLER